MSDRLNFAQYFKVRRKSFFGFIFSILLIIIIGLLAQAFDLTVEEAVYHIVLPLMGVAFALSIGIPYLDHLNFENTRITTIVRDCQIISSDQEKKKFIIKRLRKKANFTFSDFIKLKKGVKINDDIFWTKLLKEKTPVLFRDNYKDFSNFTSELKLPSAKNEIWELYKSKGCPLNQWEIEEQELFRRMKIKDEHITPGMLTILLKLTDEQLSRFPDDLIRIVEKNRNKLK